MEQFKNSLIIITSFSSGSSEAQRNPPNMQCETLALTMKNRDETSLKKLNGSTHITANISRRDIYYFHRKRLVADNSVFCGEY